MKLYICIASLFLFSLTKPKNDFQELINLFKNKKHVISNKLVALKWTNFTKTDIKVRLIDSVNLNGNQTIVINYDLDNRRFIQAYFFKKFKFIEYKNIPNGVVDKANSMHLYYGEYSINKRGSDYCFYSYSFNPINLDSLGMRPFQALWQNVKTDSICLSN